MADDVDLANKMVESELSLALERIRQQNSAQDAQGSEFCIECGDNIPTARKKLGFKICVPCAEESERKKSLFVG